jgi:hypothetical protein
MIWQGAGSSGPNGTTDPKSGQEAILGAFSGQVIKQATFAGSGLTVDMQNHTVIYYDALSATMLNKLWADPLNPDRTTVSFPEGAMVVKAAAVTPTPEQWPVLEGSGVWNVYRPPLPTPNNPTPDAAVLSLRVLQFDIIVKDSTVSPQTGWVFVTYIYDKDAPGETTFDKLVPLGAMWGNDPAFAGQPDGKDPAGGPLQETWINPAAPAYAKSSLGWGGRLSGPNDGAQQNPPYYTCTGAGCNPKAVCKDPATCKLVDVGGPNLAMSSCMSCHGVSQYAMASFLLPTPTAKITSTGQPVPGNVQGNLVFFEEGSEEWMRWFQSRPGTQPQDPGNKQVLAAADYAMNFPFKSLRYWAQEVCINQGNPDKAAACSALNNPTRAMLKQELQESDEMDYTGKKLRMR